MADHDNRHALGAFGDRGDGAAIGGFDRSARCALDVDALVLALGIGADDAALYGGRHAARRGGLSRLAHIGDRLGCGGFGLWRGGLFVHGR